MGNAGKLVQVYFVGTLDDGTVFESTKPGRPRKFICMNSNMVPGFDKAVDSMQVGETKTVHLSVDEAYGPRKPEARRTMYPWYESGSVAFDMNHPLAGKELNYEITLLSVEEQPSSSDAENI